ncbi:MAG: hypothetical protein CLLPBCKN_007429 [Chroococcidiopsis cubana SAG 39.79]|uniref:Uncharacterized protein n=1 Tax=Chroococcidiopsis cubana SAG 39.79 TaxID=388085 RepID=A0AB37UC75_9CYAN|nr:hypothetical protein [Chroococcidiopsis cubana]MDZ4877994.1 hypothetical protein [Chroococcidiopsis cubana SAG 39.79]RUT04181.1 hypothetical protein DSM107010_58180 [Chroococcidiopsis cubana SAG 39.79]
MLSTHIFESFAAKVQFNNNDLYIPAKSRGVEEYGVHFTLGDAVTKLQLNRPTNFISISSEFGTLDTVPHYKYNYHQAAVPAMV